MADALEAACNDLLPAYAELVDKVDDNGVDSLRQMLDGKCRNRKMFDILRNLDAADALVCLRDPVTEKMIWGKKANTCDTMPWINRSCKSIRDDDPSKAEAGVVLLSADTLMQAFPSEYVQHCRVLYERCRIGRRCAGSVGDRRMSASPVDEVHINDLIVDPHPLEYYGEGLHTPAAVLAMFPDM
ncbi:hypothetical protein Hanom_Chr05g00447071 [Helianthus anomalus]